MSRSPSRLFVAEELLSGGELTLDEERSHYVRRVLRLNPSDELTLFDGRGGEFSTFITAIDRTGVSVKIGDHAVRDVESPLSIHLLQGVSRGERMDWIVQKATELGVRRITPVLSEFSVVRLDEKKRERRSQHWARIAESACAQCGRNTVPVIEMPRSFDDCLQTGSGPRLRILLQPSAAAITAQEVPEAGVDLLIGPEGGFSEGEIAQATATGYVACGFGPRVLRTETAAVAAIAVLQSRWGDLAPWSIRPATIP